jgi:hypothetical protein
MRQQTGSAEQVDKYGSFIKLFKNLSKLFDKHSFLVGSLSAFSVTNSRLGLLLPFLAVTFCPVNAQY